MADIEVNGGYIIIARQIVESEIWSKPPLYAKVWLWLLMQAQHTDYRKLKRGQLFTRINDIRDGVAWKVGWRTEKPSKDQIFNILNWLRKDDEEGNESNTSPTMITTTRATQGMLITIDNYSVYQDPKNYEYNTDDNNEKVAKTTRVQRSPDNINKNVKNVKKDNSASPAEKDPIPYSEIISYLNEKTGKSFKNAAGHQKYIRARWNEGQRLDDFKRVIDLKSADWLHDDKMAKYLQPSTLFGTKFDSYLNSQPTQKPKQKQPEISEYEKAKKLNHYIWNRYNIDGKTPEEIQVDLAEMETTVTVKYVTDVIEKLKSRTDKGE